MSAKFLYTMWIIVISAVNGDVLDEEAGSKPMTLEECNRMLIEKGPIPVHDGKAIFAVCRKAEGKVGT